MSLKDAQARYNAAKAACDTSHAAIIAARTTPSHAARAAEQNAIQEFNVATDHLSDMKVALAKAELEHGQEVKMLLARIKDHKAAGDLNGVEYCQGQLRLFGVEVSC
jgi:hypothetical protein